MAYKREELDYIAAQLLPVVLEKLGVESQGVSEVEIVSDLTGVFSLPAYKKIGGVEKVVEAPVSLLQDIALDTVKAATDDAKAATAGANDAKNKANQAADTTNAVKEATILVKDKAIEATRKTEEATGKATTVTAEAKTQSDRAKELADHPTMMGDNGNWWKWDVALKKYVDTGVLAKGGVLYPTFSIDPETLELVMHYQDEIAADMFNIDAEGNLTFNPK